MRILIDHDGNTHPAFGTARDLVIDGCVTLHINSRAWNICCTPARTSVMSLGTIDRLLGESPAQRLHLTWFDGAWHDEIYGDRNQLIARIIEVMDITPYGRYLTRQAQVDQFTADNPLKPIVELWRGTGGHISMANHGDWIGRNVDTFLTSYLDDGAVRFGQFGSGWKIYQSTNWLTHCIEKRVEDQPDVDYGTWVAQNYSDMLQGIQEPIVTDCDVLISDPTGDGDKRVQYTRLNLPVIGLDNRRHLLNVSYKHESVRLRAPVA
mgnify:CR=1 FL=1